MSYTMYLDDLREPGTEFDVICRSYQEAVQVIQVRGCPLFISFDHDLGEDSPTGHDLAKWLVNTDLDSGGGFMPLNFSFYIHSANPVGSKNIHGVLTRYMQHKWDEFYQNK